MAPSLFDDREQAGWIKIVGWRRFQHYRDRDPIWIKTYLDLLVRDEYLDLSGATRAVLHGLWLLTAKRPGPIQAHTAKISRALNLKVTSAQLESLCDAGFIEIVASRALAEPEQDASESGARAPARARDRAGGELETELERSSSSSTSPQGPRASAPATAAALLEADLDEIGFDRTQTRKALADPERARAWIEKAKLEAERNVGGYVWHGVAGGQWPVLNGKPPAKKRTAEQWIREVGWMFQTDDLTDELAHRCSDEDERIRLLDLAVDIRREAAP